jgi:high-affinity nickel-transport protein
MPNSNWQLDRPRPDDTLLRPIRQRIDARWNMYPVGMLFGLGFDTATEIALLVLAAQAR